MPAFERELSTGQACWDSVNGKHVRVHSAVKGRLHRSDGWPIGNKPLDMDNTRAVLKRLRERTGRELGPITALEVFQICDNEEHEHHAPTRAYSALLERVGAIVITKPGAEPLRVMAADIRKPAPHLPDIYYTRHSVQNVPVGSPIQRLAIACDENVGGISQIIEAGISEPHHEAYVAVDDLQGIRYVSIDEVR